MESGWRRYITGGTLGGSIVFDDVHDTSCSLSVSYLYGNVISWLPPASSAIARQVTKSFLEEATSSVTGRFYLGSRSKKQRLYKDGHMQKPQSKTWTCWVEAWPWPYDCIDLGQAMSL